MPAPEDKRFSYYARLSPKDKAIYRQSDAIATVALPDAAALATRAAELEAALSTGKRAPVRAATVALTAALLAQLGAPPVKIHVREVRPDLGGAELHGLYTFAREEKGRPAKGPTIEVWMRTAAHERTVRFRTFLRTLLHEVVHHLDVTVLALGDSFHTVGFFRRESSLVRQLAPSRAKRPKATDSVGPADAPTDKQLSLFS